MTDHASVPAKTADIERLAVEYIADKLRVDTGAIGARWWCLRQDLKDAAVAKAKKQIAAWHAEEQRIKAKYDFPVDRVIS